ncbi:hypothetical protein C8J56DRAFT_921084, partial [Mycena floridula]
MFLSPAMFSISPTMFSKSNMLKSIKPTKYTVCHPRRMLGKPILYTACALASLGEVLFGYSQGITATFSVEGNFMNSNESPCPSRIVLSLFQIHPMFGKTVDEHQIQVGETGVNIWLQATSVACADITSIFASVAAAYLNDIFGRRVAIRIGAIVHFLTTILQIFTPNLPWLVTSRALQGIGVGILSTTIPVYQCEISPEHARGSFVSTEFFFLNCGYL